MQLLLASNNSKKLKELQQILINHNLHEINIITPKELYLNLEIEENADTFEGNSLLKAIAYYKASKLPVISDDSGLEIEALDNRPGVYSARYAGKDCEDAQNRTKVLEELNGVGLRNAQFKTVICFFDGEEVKYFSGECKGVISLVEKGEKGFGYDSIFIPDGYSKTFAELDTNDKNKISHRAKALDKFIEFYKHKLK